MVSLGSGACQPVTGLDTENSFSFPDPILWKIMFPSFSHALCDMGTRKRATCQGNPMDPRFPGGTYPVCPFAFLFLDMGMERTGGDGCPLPFTLGHYLSLPWNSLQCPLVSKSGQNLWAKSLGRLGSLPVSWSDRQTRTLNDTQRESREMGDGCDRGWLGFHLFLFYFLATWWDFWILLVQDKHQCPGGISFGELFLRM